MPQMFRFVVTMLGLFALLQPSNLSAARDTPTMTVFAGGSPRVFLPADVVDKLPVITANPEAEGKALQELAFAVGDFRRAFEAMTGVALPTQTGDGRLPIRFAIQDTIGLPRNDCRVDVQPGVGITLAASSRRGLINGLYTLLDGWGCRWPMPGEIGEVLPSHDTLALAAGQRDVHIASDMRTHYNYRGEPASTIRHWLVRNRAADDYWLSGQHFWGYALPPATYLDAHPEYYALVGDQRVPDQLCTTNPKVNDLMVQAAKRYFTQNPTAATFPMDPMDNFNFCQCADCVALDPPGREYGQPLVTDRVVHFANAVARGIAEDFPDRGIAFYAYLNHTQPPVDVKPDPKVHVIITRANFCLFHLTPTEACTHAAMSPAAFEDLIRRWGEICEQLYVYEYNPISWTGMMPSPLTLEHPRTIKRLHELGIRGRQIDAPHPQSASNALNHYMALRFIVDPTLDPEGELSETCDAIFGPGGGAMFGFYMAMDRCLTLEHSGRGMVGFGMNGFDRLFTPEIIAEARAHLDAALAAGDPTSPAHQRIARIAHAQELLEAYLNGCWSARRGRYADAVESFDQAETVLASLKKTDYFPWIAEAEHSLETGRRMAMAHHFPRQLGMCRDWYVLGPFDNSDLAALTRPWAWEAQERIDLSKAVESDGVEVAWRRHVSESGFYSLDEALAGRGRGDADGLSHGYALMNLWSPRATDAQLRVDSFHGLRLYLNGRQVFERPGINREMPDRFIVPVRLREGRNQVLVKVAQGVMAEHARFGFYCRLTGVDGQPLRYRVIHDR